MSNDTPALGRIDRVHLIRSDAEIESALEAKASGCARCSRAPAGRGSQSASRAASTRRWRWRLPPARSARSTSIAVRLPSRHTEQVHIDDASRVGARPRSCRDENMLTVSIEPLIDGARADAADAAAVGHARRATPARGRA